MAFAISHRMYWRAVECGGEHKFHVAIDSHTRPRATKEGLDNAGTACLLSALTRSSRSFQGAVACRRLNWSELRFLKASVDLGTTSATLVTAFQ